MTKKFDERLFDQRTLDINLARGSLKKSDYQKFLKDLPDEEGNYDTALVDEDELTETLAWEDEEEPEE
jgi:hypothetical protein